MSGLEVISAGMLSLIQDCGRFGEAHHGLSVGGPADLHAHCWANRLVHNQMNSPTIEITMGNAEFKAVDDIYLSLTGANMGATIDGVYLDNWRSFVLRKGQTLKLVFAKVGFRAYLAISGGFDIPTIFGSAATVVRNRLGGLPQRPGTPLQKGDILPVKDQINQNACKKAHTNWVPRHFIPKYSDEISLAVLESYQANQFSAQAKQAFYSKPYLFTDKFDRMGIHLKGERVDCGMSGVISEGIALGAIQFPSNGQPIILLNDRQTLGGYPKIGCISKLSLMKLGQARPGCLLNFYRGDMALETEKYCQFLHYFSL